MIGQQKLAKCNRVFYFSAVISTPILLLSVILPVEQQAYAQVPKGNAVNSKFLSVTESRYRPGDFSDQITGTITNNSTQKISSIYAYVALYDNENKLITMDYGIADVTTLAPGDQSAFSISLFNLGNEKVDHYTIFPSGLPS
jgi:hypothetical protein